MFEMIINTGILPKGTEEEKKELQSSRELEQQEESSFDLFI